MSRVRTSTETRPVRCEGIEPSYPEGPQGYGLLHHHWCVQRMFVKVRWTVRVTLPRPTTASLLSPSKIYSAHIPLTGVRGSLSLRLWQPFGFTRLKYKVTTATLCCQDL